MYEIGNYIPIIKWKRGEQAAINSLDPQVKQKITPLLEIPPIDFDYDRNVPKKSLDDHISNVGLTLSSVWGRISPVYIDLCSFSNSPLQLQNGKHPMGQIMEDLRYRKVLGVPVTGYDRDPSYQSEVMKALQIDKLGICFRIKSDDILDIKNRIKFLLETTSAQPEDVDVIIDLEYIIPGEENKNFILLNHILNNLPYLMNWRKLTLCATSFPEALPPVATAGNIQNISRSEKKLWNLMINSDIKRKPDFGDYTISNPRVFEMNPRFMTVSANIRYTGVNDFIIFKGKAIKKNGWGQIIPMAKSVISHKEYCGTNFSVGDKFIWDVAHQLLKKKNGQDTTGNSETWRTVGTNHHITFIINELSTFFVP